MGARYAALAVFFARTALTLDVPFACAFRFAAQTSSIRSPNAFLWAAMNLRRFFSPVLDWRSVVREQRSE